MNLKAAMDYMANNYESMIAESASMIGVYVPPTLKPALPVAQFFSLSYEPMVKDDPSMGAYCIDLLLPSLQDMPANRVSIYGDSVEELRAAACNEFAVEADRFHRFDAGWIAGCDKKCTTTLNKWNNLMLYNELFTNNIFG